MTDEELIKAQGASAMPPIKTKEDSMIQFHAVMIDETERRWTGYVTATPA